MTEAPVNLSVGYLVNQYPKVSHTFIRREIAALERLGVTVTIFAVRGWNAEIVDPQDKVELGRTIYLLKNGILPLGISAAMDALCHPIKFIHALAECFRFCKKSDRSIFLHYVYLIEAIELVKRLRGSGILHVHAHFGTNPAEVLTLARAYGGISYSFTIHGPEEFDKPEFLQLSRKVMHSSFSVGVSSYGISQIYRWVEYRYWHKIHQVRCGLDDGFMGQGSDITPVATRRLVCVGRLCEQKGQLLLLEAVHRLKEKGVFLELVLAGDGEMRSDIEAAIARMGLDSQVRITGWIGSDEVGQELLSARALVLPSFAEGLPVVIMEAMAMGRPVISTHVAGIPELVRPGVDGWLVAAGDVAALCDAIEECLGLGSDRLLHMGIAARQRVFDRHHVDVEAAKLKGYFEASVREASK